MRVETGSGTKRNDCFCGDFASPVLDTCARLFFSGTLTSDFWDRPSATSKVQPPALIAKTILYDTKIQQKTIRKEVLHANGLETCGRTHCLRFFLVKLGSNLFSRELSAERVHSQVFHPKRFTCGNGIPLQGGHHVYEEW